ncbi:MAG: hypothetical protein WBA76_11880, partial [Phormidesmis sp.]
MSLSQKPAAALNAARSRAGTAEVALPVFEPACFFADRLSILKLVATCLAAVGLGLTNQEEASAQVTINRDANTGAVRVNQNAYTIDTGSLTNTSNIPLPSSLPSRTANQQAIPTNNNGSLAPSSVIYGTDLDYVRANFSNVVNGSSPGPTYTLEDDSIKVTTGFNLEQNVGNHTFGEGISIRVLDANNNVVPDAVITDANGQVVDQVFVRGSRVTVGPSGRPLNRREALSVTYGAGQRVELQVLNLRENNASPSESGVYFTDKGDLIVEDLPDGGDKDFNDGSYFSLQVGSGEAIAVEENKNVTFSVRPEERVLAPETRRESLVGDTVVETVVDSEVVVSEEIMRGSLAAPELSATRLGHAVGAQTEDGKQLVYNRYASTGRISAGSDGLSAAGQLAPLNNNPSAPPTLFTGDLTFNPWVDDGQAGLSASVGVTQFLGRTHRVAEDALGNVIKHPNGPRLVEPTGFFSNRRLVSYVPDRAGETVQGERLFSVKGIFELPDAQPIVVAPPDPQQVGLGNAAYTDNVGGFLVEDAAGNLVFIPQWTNEGYARSPLSLAAGEASRLIYALVPQQAGQQLRLGQSYRVVKGDGGYQVADGGFIIISADRQPQNFLEEAAEVYAVEDTVVSGNAATPVFNGIPGIYTEPDGSLAATIDVRLAAEADARVGNIVYPLETLPGEKGQMAYAKTTRAAGLYLGGSLTGGIGNQRDTVIRSVSTVNRERDQQRSQQIINTFSTPLSQISETTVETTEITRKTGRARFDINTNGILGNATFTPVSTDAVSTRSRDLATVTTERRGEEVLADSTTLESVQTLATRTRVLDQEATTDTNRYANASAVGGEIALGGVFNFGNTPWTPAANTVRTEIFLKDTVVGRDSNGSSSGWRAALTYHPFGERQREAYQYDTAGNATALYKTEPVLDANGNQQTEVLTAADGSPIELLVNRFLVDERGDRIAQRVGTGRAKGPGMYVRVEDIWNDGNSAIFDGGVQFS